VMATGPGEATVAFETAIWISGLSCPGARLRSLGLAEISAAAGAAVAPRDSDMTKRRRSRLRLVSGGELGDVQARGVAGQRVGDSQASSGGQSGGHPARLRAPLLQNRDTPVRAPMLVSVRSCRQAIGASSSRRPRESRCDAADGSAVGRLSAGDGSVRERGLWGCPSRCRKVPGR
jgi:hypothetical protein